MDISAWLQRIGLGEYSEAFAANHVDATTLPQLTADDLRDIGVVSIGHRRRLLHEIAKVSEGAPDVKTPGASEAERRPVTVLFADLCGFTAMSRELPDERLHALLDRYLAVAAEVVKQHGGTVDKHIGDAVMALFGAPIAHDDDTLRAVRAAADLQARMPEISRQFGRPLAMHAGVAVGEVIVGGSGAGYTAIGEAVNLAARLTDLASAGEVFVSEQVQRGLTGRAQFERQGRQPLKGFAEPIAVWRLTGVIPQDATLTLTPFVGRNAELAQISALLDSCLATGEGGLVYVRGEPGIGKSRLVSEARVMAMRRSMSCHACHVLDFGAGRERDPLRRFADSLLGLSSDATPDARLRALSTFLSEEALDPQSLAFVHELAEAPLAPESRSLIDASNEANRSARRNEALSLLVRRALSRGAMFVLFEDMHWADAALAEALLCLTPIAVDRPLVLALTSRPEKERFYDLLRGQLAGAPLVTIDLGPLRTQDAASMVEHLAQLPESTMRQCVERASGNPLFLEQLLRNASEMAGELPLSLRGLVVARVDRLAASDRAAIHAAAVLGQRFDRNALQALLASSAYDPSDLLKTGLLRNDGMELVFAHALIREAVLRSLLAETQRALHERAAAWFDGRDPMLRASHLDRAGSAEAADAYRLAAEDRLRRYRHGEALPLVERGLDLAVTVKARAALLAAKGDVLLDGGPPREALQAYQEALLIANGDREKCLSLIGSASARRILDEFPPALDDVAAAQALAERNGWLDLLARCHFIRGNLYFPLGRVDECLIEHRSALDFAERSGDAEAKARALGGLGDAEYARGNFRGSGDYFRQCVEESRRIGLGRVEVSNRPMNAFSRFFDLDIPGSLALARESVALAVAAGQKRAEMIAQQVCACVLLELSEPEAARPHLERAQIIVRELEAWRFEPENLAFLAEVEIELGRPERARPLIEHGLSLARKSAMEYWGPTLLAYSARLAQDQSKRQQFLVEAETLLAGKVVAHNHYLARRALIELGRVLGDADMIDHHSNKLASFHQSESGSTGAATPFAEFVVRRGRVLAASLRPSPSPAMSGEARALLAWSTRAGAIRLSAGLDQALARLNVAAR